MSSVVKKLIKLINCQKMQLKLLGIELYSHGNIKIADNSPITVCNNLLLNNYLKKELISFS